MKVGCMMRRLPSQWRSLQTRTYILVVDQLHQLEFTISSLGVRDVLERATQLLYSNVGFGHLIESGAETGGYAKHEAVQEPLHCLTIRHPELLSRSVSNFDTA